MQALRRHWRTIAATTAFVGTSGYFYNVYAQRPKTFSLPVRVKGPDSRRALTMQTIPLLSFAEVEARIKANAKMQSMSRPNGLVWKHATAQLASNDPIEDAHAHAIVQRDVSPTSQIGDLLFFAVMDGHSGPYTSRLLSKTLIPAVGLELSRLGQEPSSFIPTSNKGAFNQLLGKTPAAVPFDANPTYVSTAIQTAFAALDSEIINAPLRILSEHFQKNPKKAEPDLSQHPMALPTILPAISGSCALLTLIDTAYDNIYVACTGDCRAVAGIWEPTPDGKGIWSVEVLSEDQTGLNPKEQERIQSEHPKDEADDVIQRGRILGGLQPTRAFGDARYKWPAKLQESLGRIFLVGNGKQMPRVPTGLKTPPYVTPQPVITHRNINLPKSSSPNGSTSSSPNTNSSLRFIVLATDGLWDELSSEEVVALVGGYLKGLSGTVSKSELSKRVPTKLSTDPSARTVEGKGETHGSSGSSNDWAFVDDNISTHLIRNAFGGANRDALCRKLSIPSPLSRRYRDDVTVTVVWWEESNRTPPNTPDQTQDIRAKL